MPFTLSQVGCLCITCILKEYFCKRKLNNLFIALSRIHVFDINVLGIKVDYLSRLLSNENGLLLDRDKIICGI